MRKRKIAARVLVLCGTAFLGFFIIFTVIFLKIKPIIFLSAKSRAETLLIGCANKAILNILDENNITYDKISNISRNDAGNITGIEIDVVRINRLKSAIAEETARLTATEEYYDITVPIGTLTGYSPLCGVGPKVRFKMQLTETVLLDFKSSFKQAGINQTLHKILITVDINASVMMLGCTDNFNVSTTAIAAQTVIVGEVPDAYTEVIEGVDSDFASDIFDYGAEEK